MSGIIGRKIGMTSFFDDEGRNIPCTVIEAGPCVVTQVKTADNDGYDAVQLAYDEKKEKHTTAALKGHFAKTNTTPKRKVAEFRDYEIDVKPGDEIKVDRLQEGAFCDVVGLSKGKGFQGVVKRHNFSGVGGATHGQHNRLRAPGSIGNASYASRVVKGKRMAGRMGGERVKVQNLVVVKVIPDNNLVLLRGAVPGANGSYVNIEF